MIASSELVEGWEWRIRPVRSALSDARIEGRISSSARLAQHVSNGTYEPYEAALGLSENWLDQRSMLRPTDWDSGSTRQAAL